MPQSLIYAGSSFEDGLWTISLQWTFGKPCPFLPTRCYASTGLCESNVSVRLSHTGIVSERRKLASRFLHYLVAPRS